MKKIKFQIKGMHCNSCAILIEEKLKNHSGIIKVKTSYDSQKAVVIYDEQKIKEAEIRQAIEEVGGYQAEKIEEKEGEVQNDDSVSRQLQSASKPSTSLKLLTGLVIISLGINIASLVIISKLWSQKENQGDKKFEAALGQVLPAQLNPTGQPPPPNDANTNDTNTAIQTFEISQSDHVRGNFRSPVTLVEFSDFECPFCARHFPTMSRILNDYNGKVRWVYKHFPLPFHPNAQKAAEASECADEQGKFWEYHDQLFENQTGGYSLEKFKQWAKELGLNSRKFDDCLDSGKYAQNIQADFQEGSQKGVTGTPATFVNGQLVSGALPYETFQQIIDRSLN